MVSTYVGKAGNHYEIKILDANLRSNGKPLIIANEFDPATFQIENVLYTRAGDVILTGRNYTIGEGNKKKEKSLLLNNYNIRIYDNMGKLKKELPTNIDGEFLISGKVVELRNELVFAAFYSNEGGRKQIDGLLVFRIDPVTGNIIKSFKKSLDNSSAQEVGYDYNPRQDKEDEEDESFYINVAFRDFYVARDNGIVILAEQYKTKIYGHTISGSGGGGTSMKTYDRQYECRDIYMAKISQRDNIDWVQVLPRRHKEQWDAGNIFPSSGYFGTIGFFDYNRRRPFWSGFNCITGKDKVNLIFNDDERNADVTGPGKKIWKVTNGFGKIDCYQISLDMVTGKYTRKTLFTYKEFPSSMPGCGAVFNITMYLPRLYFSSFSGKEHIVVGTITSEP